MGKQTRNGRDLLRRAISLCAAARWHSLLLLDVVRVGPEGSANISQQLLRLIQARVRLRQRLHEDAASAVPAGEIPPLEASIHLQVEIAFQHLRLAEQRLLLGNQEQARIHCRQFLHGLLAAAAEVQGRGFNREEEPLLLGTAPQLPTRLASQLELRRAVAAGLVPRHMILVLGMHRSGTSALSGMLCQAGFEAPADLMPADSINPRGYWESQQIFRLNEQLLQQLEASWSCPQALADGWEDGEAVVLWRRQLIDQIAQSFPGASAPLIKDPRLCILLPALLPWLESGAVRWSMLIPFRNPLEVARSLEQAQYIPRVEGLRLWLHHVFSAELFTRGHPRLMLGFEELIHEPSSSLNRCLQLLGKPNNNPLNLEATEFVSEELYRERRDQLKTEWGDSLAAITSVREMALQVFEVLHTPQLTEEELRARLDGLAFQWRLLPQTIEVKSRT